jgi:uncharacterized hydantoinase/oxoprolinase family protein
LEDREYATAGMGMQLEARLAYIQAMERVSLVALDVGGANLKIADGRGYAVSQAFPLWRKPLELAGALRRLLAEAPSAPHIVATMTGELADCFRTKAEGVAAIVKAIVDAAAGRIVEIYLTDGSICPAAAAC